LLDERAESPNLLPFTERAPRNRALGEQGAAGQTERIPVEDEKCSIPLG
jgi:hypothetical protein